MFNVLPGTEISVHA